MKSEAKAELMQSLRELFPNHVPRMEAAATEDEFYAIHRELIAETRQNLRKALASNNIPEENYASLLSLADSEDRRALSVLLLDSEEYKKAVYARGGEIKAIVQALYNSLTAIANSKEKNPEKLAARLLANRLIAMGDKGTRAADAVLRGYVSKIASGDTADAAEVESMIADELKAAGVPTAVFEGALAAASAGITISGGVVTVMFIVALLVAILVPFIFMCIEAACVMLLINGIEDSKSDYEKFRLTYYSVHNEHGIETGYTPELMSAIRIGDNVYATAGLFTTEKRTASFYGTSYGVKFQISDTNLTVAFGVESKLAAKNGCYCGFGKTAEYAAKNVAEQTHCEDKSGDYAAEIALNSVDGDTAYYIARVYKRQ